MVCKFIFDCVTVKKVSSTGRETHDVFDHFPFDDLVTKYPQVFIFVSGMLGEKATVLFTQIGEKLKKEFDWNWNEDCREEEATFFIESFNESGHPEQMAATLCKILPFPKVITLDPSEGYSDYFVDVLMACNTFSNLETPVELYADICDVKEESGVLNYRILPAPDSRKCCS